MIRKKPLSMDLVILGLRRVGIPAPCLSPSLQWALPLQQVTLRSVCWLRGNLYRTVGNLGRAGWNKQKRGNVTFETTLPLKLWVSCCVRDLSEKRNEQKWIVLGANCVRSKLSLNYFKNHESCKSQFSKTSEKCNILHLLKPFSAVSSEALPTGGGRIRQQIQWNISVFLGLNFQFGKKLHLVFSSPLFSTKTDIKP